MDCLLKIRSGTGGGVMSAASSKYSFSFPPLGVSRTLDCTIIGIGASTGGTEAVLEVLRMLPEDTPGIVVVQHMPAEGNFTAQYAERLNQICKMTVREGRHGDEIRRGWVYIAPADYHTRIVRLGEKYALTCAQDSRINGHRPAVDALFHSMAETIQGNMVGIIMTGMGADGAQGLLAMHRKGAYTIGQDEESSVVYGMPYEAHKIGAVDAQASCEGIAGLLIQHLKKL